MQIIIIQTEIEEAIRAHINRQINVRPGMRIDIDLSATRGPEGFKATIDIVADDSAPAQPATDEPQPAEPVKSAKPAQAIRGARPVAQAKPTDAAQTSTTAEQANDTTDVADVAEAPAEAQDGPSEDDTPPATVGRSLFGNLPTPSNK